MKGYTPQKIEELKENEIFVFGSNEKGQHVGGAARLAFDKWGATWGQGFGRSGNTFAIPTLKVSATLNGLEKLELSEIKSYVDKLFCYCWTFDTLDFYITEIGCGIAGFTYKQIGPLFKEFKHLPNVYLPKNFLN